MTKEGTVLDGKYEIWKEVGRGGMSIVYLARDNRLNKQWAVKEIRNDGSKATDTLLKGLEREANILKNVDHPVLPRIVDIINQKGTIYVVMDFIEGETISQRLKREGAQSQEDVIDWGLQLASALDYLHKMDPPVIYRDMKPSNVMIKPEGGVKLIDFGTAKEYDVENLADTTALGTKGYAAPEQFGDSKGRGIYNTDERTDIYNLGATLYHMVTGKNPCEPPYEMRPIREWNPALSTGLEKIILKCIQSDPKDRYQNCSELIYDLEHHEDLDDSFRKKNRIKFAAFASTLALSIIAAGVMVYGHKGMKRIKMENYNTYIEEGNSHRSNGEYSEAIAEYKNAFNLDSDDERAYLEMLSMYIIGSHEYTDDGKPVLDLDEGLTFLAGRITTSNGSIEASDAVLFRMGFTYFDEIKDYKTASKYFSLVDESDEEYGELAGYYLTVSKLLSSNEIQTTDFEKISAFVEHTESQYTNKDQTKYINYKMIGMLYAKYINKPGVAKTANDTMIQALESLSEYEGEDMKDFYYCYYDNLIEINQQLALDAESEDAAKAAYENVISYANETLVIINMRDGSDPMQKIGGTATNSNNSDYVNKMDRIAKTYGKIGDFDNAVKTYEELEQKIGKENALSASVYASHLDYIYSYCDKKNSDVSTWKKSMPDKYEMLMKLYDEGCDVVGIEDSVTWGKRVSTMETLKNSVDDEESEDTDEDADDADGQNDDTQS